MLPDRLRPRAVAALILLGLAAAGAGPAAAQTTREEITLMVGEQTSVSAEGVRSYSEGAPNIVNVRVPKDGSEFVIVALRPGTTSLLLLKDDGSKVQYSIRVLSTAPKDGAISERENIRLDFYFVELSETYGHQVGIGWPANIGGGGAFRANAAFDLIEGSAISATAVVANQPLPRLDILQSSGWVRIGRQAVLVTANGHEATFSSGGEVNLQIQGALTAEIRSIEFGSLIRVLPRYDRETGRIELTIGADVSELTDDRGSGVPGRTVSRLETLVNLELGQAVMLAGLNAHSHARGRAGLPLLSQIPVFGYLFGSDSSRAEKTQNVLFILPTVVDVVQADARGRIADAFRVFEQYDGSIDEIDLPGKPPKEGRRRGRRERKR